MLTNLKSVLAEFFPLHRTLSSYGQYETLKIIGKHMPEGVYTIYDYKPISKVWTWKIPEYYIVHEAYLEHDGKRIVDFNDSPLSIVSYSLSIDCWLDLEEFSEHLYYSDKQPDAIPWMFKYYERDWGFCLPKNVFDNLPTDGQYHAVIKSEFRTDFNFKVGTAVVYPENSVYPPEEFLVSAHTCHPAQANDDGSGVVCAIELVHRFTEFPLPEGSMAIRFLFAPETIGSIAYLAHKDTTRIKGGMFLEMTGNDNELSYHHTRQGDSVLDKITEYVFTIYRYNSTGRDFASAPANDERVINGPGVNIPCVSLNRWPYPEYHTSNDNMDIIDEYKLLEATSVAEEIIRIYASNYIPVRTFTGPLFLSGYGLWVDWRDDPELNKAIEQITMNLEGRLSIFEIAQKVGLDYWTTREYIEKMIKADLVTRGTNKPYEYHD